MYAFKKRRDKNYQKKTDIRRYLEKWNFNIKDMPKKILFSWGTHVGKTSVLEFLESEWYTRKISVAGANMKMLRDLIGEKEYPNYRKENFQSFQLANIYDDLKLYHQSLKEDTTKDDIIFFDRWVFDRIASLKREWYTIDNSLEKLISEVKYDAVFIFSPLSTHSSRKETARLLDAEISEKWAALIEKEYKNRWYTPIHVPDIAWEDLQDSIKKRADYVFKNL